MKPVRLLKRHLIERNLCFTQDVEFIPEGEIVFLTGILWIPRADDLKLELCMCPSVGWVWIRMWRSHALGIALLWEDL